MKKSFIILSALFCLLTLNSCKKQDRILPIGETVCHCGVDDPLNDLRWLHELALEFESMRGKQFASISICTYDSTSQGFLFTDCEECPDRGLSFVDCQGRSLGLVGGFAGTPLEAYHIDPSSVRLIYRNYPDTSATIANKTWRLVRFFDRETRTAEIPIREHDNGVDTLAFWLRFYDDGTLQGGGINYLNGTYTLYDRDRIHINIGCATEIYDMTGWEDRMLAALCDATICDVDYYGKKMIIYYDGNRKYLEWERMPD
jgi:hypothetical protein